MNRTTLVSFDQFCLALTEYVSRRRILANYAECLSLYAQGYDVTEVGAYLRAKNGGRL